MTLAPAWAGYEGDDEQKPFRLGVVGAGRRGRYLLELALREGVEAPALCDIRRANLEIALDIVEKARGRRPEGYSNGPEDYRRMLQRDDLDAVLIGTDMQLHAPIAVAAMRAGKHVLSEVSGAMTIEECWDLVRSARETGMVYMLAENCCYWREPMMVRRMVESGVFGRPTYAECGYVHDCRHLEFEPDGSLTWRGRLARDWPGNNYPTHSFGPVAQWLGINRGDRMVSLMAASTGSLAHEAYVAEHCPEQSPARRAKFKGHDSVTALIRTANDVLIDLRYDTSSSRPTEGPYHALQGVKAAYDSRLGNKIWIEGCSKGSRWDPIDKYQEEFEHPLWTSWREKTKGVQHGGGDFFVTQQFIEAVRSGGPSPIDAIDSAAWSAILPLTAQSLSEGGRAVDCPDFTKVFA
ncbi:MAG: Gfo/Idh/MocA family oxidoreductase [Pirellulales bacterium]|nr:Gfo/Idh/MocA family oxidoreductase [Pirellulales bacterium]